MRKSIKAETNLEIKVMVVWLLTSWPSKLEAWVRVPIRKGLVSYTTLKFARVTVDCISK